MWLVFERFLGIVAHWARTGEWRSDEFKVRGSRTATYLAWAFLAALAVAVAWLALAR